MADYVSGEQKCGVVRIEERPSRSFAYTCARAVRHDGEHKDRDGAHWLGKGPILWPSEKLCDAATSDGVSCVLAKGHDGGHRNVYSTATWSARPCTYIYGPNGNRCAFANGDEQHGHRTSTGLGYMHQDQWRPVQGAATVTDAPGKRSDDESVAKQLAALQRKVRAQANQINKLEDLRRAAVDKQPEYQKLIGQLEAQASLTERENRLRRKVEQLLDHERKRRGEPIGSLLMDIRSALGDPVDSVPPSWATWSELRKQVGRLINELDKHRERAEAAEGLRSALVKLAARVDEMSMGPSAEYGTTPLAARVDELAKTVAEMSMGPSTERRDLNRLIGLVGAENWNNRRHLVSVTDLGDMAEGLRSALVELERRTDELAMETVRRCESWNSGTRCVGYPRHAGAHSGPGTERWA